MTFENVARLTFINIFCLNIVPAELLEDLLIAVFSFLRDFPDFAADFAASPDFPVWAVDFDGSPILAFD